MISFVAKCVYTRSCMLQGNPINLKKNKKIGILFSY